MTCQNHSGIATEMSERKQGGSSALVTVVIPCFRVGEYIGQAIKSVLKQTYQNFEIIVVDDGCPDTLKLKRELSPYSSRVRYIRQSNKGCGAARNTAINQARGEWIALLDGDDIWRPNYLFDQLSFARTTNADCVYPNAQYFGASPLSGRHYMDIFPSNGPVTIEALVLGACNVFVGALVRADTIRNAGGFDERLRSCEDLDLWIRLVLKGGTIVYHRKVLVDYRQRPGSLSSAELDMLECKLKIFDSLTENGALTLAQSEAVHIAKCNASSDRSLLLGKRALVNHQFPRARRYLERSGRHLGRSRLRLLLRILRGPYFVSRAFVSIASRKGMIRRK